MRCGSSPCPRPQQKRRRGLKPAHSPRLSFPPPPRRGIDKKRPAMKAGTRGVATAEESISGVLRPARPPVRSRCRSAASGSPVRASA
ncbi:hypothetical protein EBB06_09495 [Crenobacter cavernae]|uniref:Uncharacterized protein n=1 Tax=Crenobacter cavernae TaxID=2290923 RepID=A0ABY0FG05_9NEIS|nr:hypothetical protein EBB06_09495 [Crenobacter cavernae]